ncbi:MAG: glycosyltransferase [Acidobacteria bacterium]|nr:MAG: glycosyltransferase [Acidobacteriota bacterium]
MSDLELSLIIPLYNEAGNLAILASEIERALAPHAGRYEVIFVDDGSTDDSPRVLAELAAKLPQVRVLRSRRNQGQSAALAAGFAAARAPVVVTLDADLQNDPADVPILLAALEGCDVVSGVRHQRRDNWRRRLASRIANRVRNAVVHDGVSDVGCSLKAYRTELLRRIPVFDGMHRFLPALLRMEGARIKEVPVRHRPRVHGTSKYTISNRLWRGILDLLGVRWLALRHVDPRLVEEVTPLRRPATPDAQPSLRLVSPPAKAADEA